MEAFVKSLHTLKRAMEMHIDSAEITDIEIDRYIQILRKDREALPVWLVEEESNYLLLEQILRVLKSVAGAKERIDLMRLMINFIPPLLEIICQKTEEHAKNMY